MSSIGRKMGVPTGLSRTERAALIGYCRWPDCGEPRHEASDAPPLCGVHLIRCAVYAAEVMDEFYDAADLVAGREMRALREQHRLHPSLSPARPAPVVYYVRIGNHVKIGTTTNLSGRLRSFYVDESALLGVEPGGYDVEAQRHRHFKAERVFPNRELFNPSRRLLAHIESLKQAAA